MDKLPDVPADSPLLTPVLTPREPALISDGGGLPFAPEAPLADFEPLDPNEPAVQALIAQIDLGRKQAAKRGFLRRSVPLPPLEAAHKLAGWRVLAAAENELLYAKGRPPQLLTVAVKRAPREKWLAVGVSNSRPLRSSRDGVRASSWRLDPDFEVSPDQTELHLFVTEQTQATGRPAEDRMLPPDLYIGDDELVLRLYIKGIEGYVGRTRRYETAVTVALPEPLGERAVVDGALYQPVS
jgi:hypothetical protein